MSSVIDGIRQAQCLAVAVPAASCSRSGAGSGKTPVAKTGTGPRDDARVHVGRTKTAAKLVRGGQDTIVSKVRRRHAVQ